MKNFLSLSMIAVLSVIVLAGCAAIDNSKRISGNANTNVTVTADNPDVKIDVQPVGEQETVSSTEIDIDKEVKNLDESLKAVLDKDFEGADLSDAELGL